MEGIKLMQGDCIEMMAGVEDGSVDMVLTDPPYCSGGLFPGDRKKTTKEKYTDNDYNGASTLPDFSGDNMDQRAFTEFMRTVLMRARRKTKQGGICAVFIDWRNISAMTDALQMAGWIYSGIIVWDKGNSRPTPDRFRNDCEYIVWGTNGKRKAEYKTGVFVGKGCHHIKGMNTREKHHQTEKPTELIGEILKIVPEGGTVLDMFMGSGSTGVACVSAGRRFVGIELDEYYFQVAKERIEEAVRKNLNKKCKEDIDKPHA